MHTVRRPFLIEVYMKLILGECLEELKKLPSESVSLVLTDPPYNIGKAAWDKIDNYIDWCMEWIKECERVLRPNGSMYIWHNDIPQIAPLLVRITQETALIYRQFNIWVKPNFRCMAWKRPASRNTLRNWFNICEYCLYFVKEKEGKQGKTGLELVNSNPGCYRPLKEWYAKEKERLGITNKDIAQKYTEATGRKPYMLRHYFQNKQFEIPTEKVWNEVFIPLGFSKKYEELRRGYEELRRGYEELRREYEELRTPHFLDNDHCNVWHSECARKNHICEKPVDMLERIIRTSSRPGELVLDCFMGSGSTGVAAMNAGREFIGIENDRKSYDKAVERTSQLMLALGE